MTGNRSGTRLDRATERRTAIIDAALAEFTAKGFAGAKVEDIARRAGVAKGTVYLNFADKQALFEAMVRDYVTQPLAEMAALIAGMTDAGRMGLDDTILSAAAAIPLSRTGDVMRLLISEGLRFPQVADLYYHEVLLPIMTHQRERLAVLKADGRLNCPELADFPQLLMAPMFLGVIWKGLFDRIEPLDIEGMLKAHSRCIERFCIRHDGDGSKAHSR